MRLSPHFSLEELTRSDYALRHGLDNTPAPWIVEKLKNTARGLERVRDLFGCRVIVSSGYRSPAVNRGAGGSEKSQHMKGEAADIEVPAYGPPRDICHMILKYADTIDFDQLILEFDAWCHVSFSDHPRRSVLTARHLDGRVQYFEGIA